ncbi:hypothetical protein [Parvularcula dongshanensis]|uniref:Low affinity Fe/Cu permease n=1 Tax=Parvularcula dongshanensis TaxID=1173995 RepID=A0A840I0U9_9PROT|nr:hypothetical protein [Parvularcula dongshanensis]MBB4657965.1 low affinity Fe/Cu permease [Parvularcula dongshanensis]
MSDPQDAMNASLDHLREEATDDEQRDQVDIERGDAKNMKEAADDADSEQGIGAGVKSSGDVKN